MAEWRRPAALTAQRRTAGAPGLVHDRPEPPAPPRGLGRVATAGGEAREAVEAPRRLRVPARARRGSARGAAARCPRRRSSSADASQDTGRRRIPCTAVRAAAHRTAVAARAAAPRRARARCSSGTANGGRIRPHRQRAARRGAPCSATPSATARSNCDVAAHQHRRRDQTDDAARRRPAHGRAAVGGGSERGAAAPSASASTGVRPMNWGWTSRLSPANSANHASSPRARDRGEREPRERGPRGRAARWSPRTATTRLWPSWYERVGAERPRRGDGVVRRRRRAGTGRARCRAPVGRRRPAAPCAQRSSRPLNVELLAAGQARRRAARRTGTPTERHDTPTHGHDRDHGRRPPAGPHQRQQHHERRAARARSARRSAARRSRTARTRRSSRAGRPRARRHRLPQPLDRERERADEERGGVHRVAEQARRATVDAVEQARRRTPTTSGASTSPRSRPPRRARPSRGRVRGRGDSCRPRAHAPTTATTNRKPVPSM